MEMTTIAVTVAGGAVGLAIIIAIKNAVTGHKKNVPQENAPSAASAMGAMAAVRPPLGVKPKGACPPLPPRPKKRVNERGWRAPVGHYFNDDDELLTDAGGIILDMMMVAQLCGEQHAEPVDEVVPAVEAVGTETIASRPEPVVSEVTPSSSFSDLQTTEDTRHHAAAPAPEPSDYSGGDSGGGDSGGGGDCGGGDD